MSVPKAKDVLVVPQEIYKLLDPVEKTIIRLLASEGTIVIEEDAHAGS